MKKKSTHKADRVLRASPWAVGAVGVAALLFVVGFMSTYRNEGWNWKSMGFGVFSILGFLGLLETTITRIVLSEDALRIVSLFSKKSYPRSEIQELKQEWKSAVFLRLTSGGWVEIPWMLVSKKLIPSVRTWLKGRGSKTTGGRQ
ncbi:MAG: hypothetical protein L0387_00400 [Acidobacteria bacterium]|nr:hypothetical protein [Acidobacteriota bacterium]